MAKNNLKMSCLGGKICLFSCCTAFWMLFVMFSLHFMMKVSTPPLDYSELSEIYNDVLPIKIGYNSLTHTTQTSTDGFFDGMKADY